jgi:hypothetical protein
VRTAARADAHLPRPLRSRLARGRFIYLNWVAVGDADPVRLFRRAKLMLDGVPPEVLDEAGRTGLLIGRLALICAGRADSGQARRAWQA